MSDTYEHLFLIPLKSSDRFFLEKVKENSEFDRDKFGFLLSITDKENIKLCHDILDGITNVYIINPDSELERTQHWEYISKTASLLISYNTFSYYFSGDDLQLATFPELSSESDLYINDYFINEWGNIKENASERDVKLKKARFIINKSFLMGKPPLAPLQRIIFKRDLADYIEFNSENSYVSDQLMVFSLIESGRTVQFIKSPFYKLNESKRIHLRTLRFLEIVRQQIYLYLEMKCYAGLPIILLRTFCKHYILRNN